MTDSANGQLVFVGTYTAQSMSEGIYTCRFFPDTRDIEPLFAADGVENPSFLALHPSRRFLYAASEVDEFDGKSQGALFAYAIEPNSGRLTLLNAQGSGGTGPCHIFTDSTGRFLLAANYRGGSASVLPIAKDGSLRQMSCFIQHEGSSVNKERQTSAHAHSINLDPQNRFAYVPDLGMDKVMIYQFDEENGQLCPNDPPYIDATVKGAGPRHFAFAQEGRYAYVVNEIGKTVTAYRRDADTGALSTIQTIIAFPENEMSTPGTTADIHVHPNGKFVYASNRGHDSIAVFARFVDGSLSPIQHMQTGGKTPRNFAIDPSGRFLLAANQDSNTIVTLDIDAETGMLNPTKYEAKLPMPVCIRFMDET